MRMTFIRDEISGHQVIVNGVMREIAAVPQEVPSGVYAVQVYTTYTEVENGDLTNDVFAEPPSYVQSLVAAWEAAEPIPEPEAEGSGND